MTNEQVIYQYLISVGLTPAGASGLMGNLKAESGLMPGRAEMLCLTRLSQAGKKYNDATYTAAVDSGKISKEEFLNPLPGKQYGYGLAQWTSPCRKEGLYDKAKEEGKSIGNLEMQLEYLMEELSTSYKSVMKILKTTDSIKEASDIVLTRFECPADSGEKVKDTREKYSQEIYNRNAEREVTDMKLGTASAMIATMQSYIGLKEPDGDNIIIGKYNKIYKRAVKNKSYIMTNTDAWCAATVSVAADESGNADTIPIDCNCQAQVDWFKAQGRWKGKGHTPKTGNIIYYDWEGNGWSDHVGVVEKVSGKTITVIEGNYDNACKRRTITVGDDRIMGYGIPAYKAEDEVETCTLKLPVLRKGDNSRYVKNVRRLFRSKKYKGANGKLLKVNKKFDQELEDVVTEFQKKCKYPETGQMDAKTWKRLLNSY